MTADDNVSETNFTSISAARIENLKSKALASKHQRSLARSCYSNEAE